MLGSKPNISQPHKKKQDQDTGAWPINPYVFPCAENKTDVKNVLIPYTFWGKPKKPPRNGGKLCHIFLKLNYVLVRNFWHCMPFKTRNNLNDPKTLQLCFKNLKIFWYLSFDPGIICCIPVKIKPIQQNFKQQKGLHHEL